MRSKLRAPAPAVWALVLPFLLAACGSSAAATPSPTATPTPTPSPTASPTPTPAATDPGLPAGIAYADLDGLPVAEELAHRLPMAIMIDDNKIARPQSGFNAASIVYQAPADGGEDRYMLIFQEGTATDIGPVRSARPYFVYWAAEYKALYGHYGGDAESLQVVIPKYRSAIYDMDALHFGSCPYHRITTRVMPHNAYTNSAALIACLPKMGYPATFQEMPLRPFRDDAPAADRPETQSITIPYPTGTILYTYDPASDSYTRFIGGHKQIDAADNQVVTTRNVIVLYQQLSTDPVTHRPIVASVGTGKALVFLEGRVILGTWKKDSQTDLTRLYDANGAEIPLVRGRIFVQCVPLTTKVAYT